jgi:hypothetical protein
MRFRKGTSLILSTSAFASAASAYAQTAEPEEGAVSE